MQRMLMRSEELSRMNESFLPREPIYKCTMKAKEEPKVLVLIVDCALIVYSRVYLLQAPDRLASLASLHAWAVSRQAMDLNKKMRIVKLPIF
jgi:hypothetical protein